VYNENENFKSNVMIKAQVVADSLSPYGDRLTTYVVTFPRIILAELNTHRMLSKNSASSRAIPFKKMVESVKSNPFIPLAWQKDHAGMQGTEYLSKTDKFCLNTFLGTLIDTLQSFEKDSEEYPKLEKEIDEKIKLLTTILAPYQFEEKTLDDWWLFARDKAVEAACIMYVFRTTKQLCNRLLEPFMWHTVIISGTEWENFFALRCPQYTHRDKIYRSKKNLIEGEDLSIEMTDLDWLSINKGQAEIHMMALAEAIWDARNESYPKQLQAGEWHIPFEDKINTEILKALLPNEEKPISVHFERFFMLMVKVATAMCARVSYTVVGDEKEISYERLIDIHDNKIINAKPLHASPLEHCAQVPTELEYYSNIRGEVSTATEKYGIFNHEYYPIREQKFFEPEEEIVRINPNNGNRYGWFGNFRGFKQYRKMIPNENIEG